MQPSTGKSRVFRSRPCSLFHFSYRPFYLNKYKDTYLDIATCPHIATLKLIWPSPNLYLGGAQVKLMGKAII